MNSYEQRTENITKKAKGITTRRQMWLSVVSCVCCVAIVFGVVLATIPSDNSGINAYKKSEYFPLIQKINTFKEKYGDSVAGGSWLDDVAGFLPGSSDSSTSAPDGSGSTDPSTSVGDKYEESTLNQVEGVTEGDVLKRSKNYAFYLTVGRESVDYYYKLSAYSIAREDTVLVGEFDIKAEESVTFNITWQISLSNTEMYLSEDAKTLTLVSDCYNASRVHYTCVISLDVSNPSDIVEISRTYVAGRYLSSRKVNGELLLVTNFYVESKPDFNDPTTFIPSYGALDDRAYFKMNEIYCPEYLSECTYTVIAKISESTLEVTSKQAILSYTFDVAVSTEHIYVIRNREEYVQNNQTLDSILYAEDGTAMYHHVSEIVCLEYRDQLNTVGCVQLEGVVKSRYSLDEKDGILRVVTQTTHYEYKVTHNDKSPHARLSTTYSTRSASLYCVDLSEMQVVGAVNNFAPHGETVQAVRFNGDNAYVCTAVINTDPVFVFDLSDINNITYKDTGTIPGFSINLIKFGDYLLGIGYGSTMNSLKIELYRETDSNVESVATYEKNDCGFSTAYKAHFIDVEHQLVGLQITDYEHPGNRYIFLLLQFDSETQTWRQLLWQKLISDVSLTRAFYEDGLYLIGRESQLLFFSEEALWGVNVA